MIRRFLIRICRPVFLPLAWTILTIVLLCLPGSAIPGEGIFAIAGFDKFVHITLFGGITLFWGFHIYPGQNRGLWKKQILLLTLLTIFLGIVLEYLQLYVIPNRTFDIADMLADAFGAIAALVILFTGITGRGK